MAIDTIRIESPYITEELATYIENQSIVRQGLDLKNGELLYEICTSQLEGSFDNRIMVQVERKKLFYDAMLKCTYKKQTEPFLVVEGSIHKAAMGHNVFGGPESFRKSVYFFVNLIESLLQLEECSLPCSDFWEVKRVDWAEVFDMGSFEVCQEYFRGINLAEYPRRQVRKYGIETLYFPGSTTTTKFYHKGPEFYKRDRKKLLKILDKEIVNDLQLYANNIIRVEVEIKSRKLKYDFGRCPLVNDVNEEYLKRTYDREVEKVLRDGKRQADTVRTARSVQKRLYDLYGDRLAKILFGTWMELTTFGRTAVKEKMPERTFYRQLGQLEKAGVDWKNTDVVLKEQHEIVPVDFSPIRSDKRRISEQSKEVIEKIERIAS